jgi:hypothetical protein
MIAEAIEKILSLGTIESITSNGLPYTTKPMIPTKEPHPLPLELATLTGLVAWVRRRDSVAPDAALESSDPDCRGCNALATSKSPLYVHVASPTEVHVVSHLDEWMERDRYIVSKHAGVEMPSSGRYIPLEEMVIRLKSQFVQSGEDGAPLPVQALIAFLGNITSDEVVNAADDGFSQSVTVKTGVGSRIARDTLPPQIMLRPYRTFHEVQQPDSLFVVRLKRVEKGLPEVALIEGDGGAWRNTARLAIERYLKDQLADLVESQLITVLA